MKNLSKQGFTVKIEIISHINILFLMLLFSFSLILNNVADIAKVLKSDIQLSDVSVVVFCFWFIILYFTSFYILPYKVLTLLIKCLFAIALIYLVCPLLVKQDWFSVLKSTFIPTLKLNNNFLITLTAVLLTTISPYLFFKHSSN